MSAAAAAGYLYACHRSDAALARMQRAMDDIYEGGKKRDARRAVEAAEGLKRERETNSQQRREPQKA